MSSYNFFYPSSQAAFASLFIFTYVFLEDSSIHTVNFKLNTPLMQLVTTIDNRLALPCFAGPGGVKCNSLHALSTTQWQNRGDGKPNLPPPFTTTSNALSSAVMFSPLQRSVFGKALQILCAVSGVK